MLYMLHMVPYIGYKTPTIIYACQVMLLYLVILGFGGRMFLLNLKKVTPIFYLYILDIVRIAWKGGNLLIEVYSALQLIILPITALVLIKVGNEKIIRRLLYFQLFLWGITAVTTYYGCLEFPLASRFLATSLRSEDPELYGLYCSLNIGGFHYIYYLVLCIPFVVLSIKENIINRFFCIVLLYVAFIAIRQSEYTTAIIMFFLSFLLFFMPKNFDRKMFCVFVLFGIFAVWYGTNYLGDLLLSISEQVKSANVSTRLRELGYMFNGDIYSENSISDLKTRQDLLVKSMDTFKAFPVLGSWNPNLVGGHSLLFDTMGKYGLLGIVAYIIMYHRVFKLFIRKSSANNYGFILFSYVLVIGLGILNPHAMYYFLLFFMPVSIYYVRNK